MILSLKKKHTVVLSSHILSEITKTCDRILIVDKGRLVAEGDESMLGTGNVKAGEVTVICEVKNAASDLRSKLESLSMVKSVASKPGMSDTTRIVIEMNRDGRAEVARVVVESGSGLVGMVNEGRDLENLFMKFVRS
jgi:ABC-2 type transport system ATP-binding protein